MMAEHGNFNRDVFVKAAEETRDSLQAWVSQNVELHFRFPGAKRIHESRDDNRVAQMAQRKHQAGIRGRSILRHSTSTPVDLHRSAAKLPFTKLQFYGLTKQMQEQTMGIFGYVVVFLPLPRARVLLGRAAADDAAIADRGSGRLNRLFSARWRIMINIGGARTGEGASRTFHVG